ncbi:ureohydrolase [Podospora didyma]|uniref:Ureohydrolase n=1 Tax=Podospora didyma TaxID=330526 RepID=A0AAE0N916_9PEZI|nr:ureohydrolase [Podospora didyma]
MAREILTLVSVVSALLVLLNGLVAEACNTGGGGHGKQQQQQEKEWTPEQLAELERKWGFEWGFGGIGTFAHLKHVKCLTTPNELFDIGIIGAPFDTATSYRPGARFGPRAIRQASARQTSFRGFNHRAGINPYQNWAKIIDCGDIPISPLDNTVALTQMAAAFTELGLRGTVSPLLPKPKLITLGGDHSLALPALRALRQVYGRPLRVLHFDAHLDTWHPDKYPSAWPSNQAHFNHGSMFWLAGNEGLLSNASTSPSVHAGLRTRLSGDGWDDFDDDTKQNWVRLIADDIDDIGTSGIVKTILDSFAFGVDSGEEQAPVYLSIDIDVLDPAFAPGTGTPEPGGWTTRELIRILRGIEGLNIVGADVVEVAPAYQGAGEETALAAAQVVYEILSSMVKKGMQEMGKTVRRHDEL